MNTYSDIYVNLTPYQMSFRILITKFRLYLKSRLPSIIIISENFPFIDTIYKKNRIDFTHFHFNIQPTKPYTFRDEVFGKKAHLKRNNSNLEVNDWRAVHEKRWRNMRGVQQ